MNCVSRNLIRVVLGLLVAGNEARAAVYSVLNLGTLVSDVNFTGYSESLAYGIDQNGQVVGHATMTLLPNGDRPAHAFGTQPDSPINPATDGLAAPGVQTSDGRALNLSGQVVGSFQSTSESNSHAFRTAPNSPINPLTDDLGTLGGSSGSVAYGINSSGVVVGDAAVPSNYGHAFRTPPGRPIDPLLDDLGTLGGIQSGATGINDLGQVVGASPRIADYPSHAFRTSPNSPINPLTDDLGTLGGANSAAFAINNLGVVVGTATVPDGSFHAFRTAPNAPINPLTDDLGTLGGAYSSANAVNEFGTVVGESSPVGVNPIHAFIYEGSAMSDLNSLVDASGAGWVLSSATGINDNGAICGWGYLNGDLRGFVLTPVPEPSTLALASLAAIGCFVLAHRNR